MKYYVPGFNEEVIYLNEELIIPENKLVDLIKKIYFLNKQYKIEKIISFNNKDYSKEIKEILNNNSLELYNHCIDSDIGYFHITFEKEILKDNKDLNYDKFCPYAISLIVR